MKRIVIFGISVISLFLAALPGRASEQTLNFKEVFDLLRTNLVGVTETELNRAAAEGLLTQLQPKVVLITNQLQSSTDTNASNLRSNLFDAAYGYVHLGQITPDSAQQLRAIYQNFVKSSRFKGLILDLRFTDGQDYKSATAVADCFFSTEQPLIDYGDGVKNSTPKTNAFNRPLAILVNRKTAGAAEAVAGMLRQADVGLVIGSPTAGLANIAKEFTLQTGQKVRVAQASIKVGKDEALPLTGVKPDIAVDVTLQDEMVYFEDAYRDLSKANRLAKLIASGGSTNQLSGTNRPRHRINEAELVRMLRDGETLEDSNIVARSTEPAKPVVQDPALARSLDLLKGLSVLRQFRTL